MSDLTVRITKEDGVITAWVDKNGAPWIKQPFEPDAGPFKSEAAAQRWADAFVEEQLNPPAAVEPE